MNVYLDHNATTAPADEVREAMLPWLGRAANPSSPHAFGRAARDAVEQAREQVAELVGAHPGQLTFTSGGTESNNTALFGVTAHTQPGRILVGSTEHPSVLEAARRLAGQGWRLDELAVDGQGGISPESLRAQLNGSVRLVSIMWANNETGVIQDIPALAAVARQQGVLFHTDAVQAAGKLALDFPASGAHLMSLTAHKMYGPVGIGALVQERQVDMRPLLLGGGQEKGLRGGTSNVAGMVGFGKAAQLASSALDERRRRALELRLQLESGIADLPGATVIAARAKRLSNTSFISLAGIDGETLVINLDRQGLAVATGSACGTNRQEASHVLKAMGIPLEQARGVIRVSTGKDTRSQDIERLLTALRGQVQAIQRFSGMLGNPALH